MGQHPKIVLNKAIILKYTYVMSVCLSACLFVGLPPPPPGLRFCFPEASNNRVHNNLKRYYFNWTKGLYAMNIYKTYCYLSILGHIFVGIWDG